MLSIVASVLAVDAIEVGSGWDAAACVPSTLNLCAKINVHAGLYASHNPTTTLATGTSPQPSPRSSPQPSPLS